MSGFEVFEKPPRVPDLPLFCVLQSLPDALPGMGVGGNIQPPLVRFGVPNNGPTLGV